MMWTGYIWIRVKKSQPAVAKSTDHNRSRFRSEFRSRIHTQTHTDTHTHTQPLSRTCQISWVVDISRCEEGFVLFVYYESTKREQKIKPIYECRCDERLQTKTKRFTRLSYTGLVMELEHLTTKTRLTNEKFASVKGECEI